MTAPLKRPDSGEAGRMSSLTQPPLQEEEVCLYYDTRTLLRLICANTMGCPHLPESGYGDIN